MKVSYPLNQKIIINLTNTEVLTAFGSYEKLLSLDKNTKYAIYSLIREVISKNKIFNKTDKILAKIKLEKTNGCEITLIKEIRKHTLFLKTTFELDEAISILFPNKKDICESSLYKTQNGYYLFLESEKELPINIQNCKMINSPIFSEHIKEYGKPLIKNDAIKIYWGLIKDS